MESYTTEKQEYIVSVHMGQMLWLKKTPDGHFIWSVRRCEAQVFDCKTDAEKSIKASKTYADTMARKARIVPTWIKSVSIGVAK